MFTETLLIAFIAFFTILCFVFLLQKSKSFLARYFNGVQLLLMSPIHLINVGFSGVTVYTSQLSSELLSDPPDYTFISEIPSEDILSCTL